MSRYLSRAAAIIGIVFSCTILAAPTAATWQNPVIKAAGGMVALPDAAFQPDKTITYNAVFSVTHFDAKHPNDPDGGLVPVARAVNVFASAGAQVAVCRQAIAGFNSSMVKDAKDYSLG